MPQRNSCGKGARRRWPTLAPRSPDWWPAERSARTRSDRSQLPLALTVASSTGRTEARVRRRTPDEWPGRRTWGDARRPGGWDLRQDEHALVFGRGVFRCLGRIVVRELRSGIVSGRSVAAGLPGQRFGLVVALAATRKHLHGRGHDLSLPMALSPVVFPLAGLQPAFDGHLLALAKVLTADLGEAIPYHDVVILRALLAVAAVLVGGHCERGDVRSAGKRPDFRIASQPAG